MVYLKEHFENVDFEKNQMTKKKLHSIQRLQFNSIFNLVLLNLDFILFVNNVDPDQLATDEAISSGSTLFSSWIENTCFQLKCRRLTG